MENETWRLAFTSRRERHFKLLKVSFYRLQIADRKYSRGDARRLGESRKGEEVADPLEGMLKGALAFRPKYLPTKGTLPTVTPPNHYCFTHYYLS